MKKKVILTILDGMGYRAETAGNAVAAAHKPTALAVGHEQLGNAPHGQR